MERLSRFNRSVTVAALIVHHKNPASNEAGTGSTWEQEKGYRLPSVGKAGVAGVQHLVTVHGDVIAHKHPQLTEIIVQACSQDKPITPRVVAMNREWYRACCTQFAGKIGVSLVEKFVHPVPLTKQAKRSVIRPDKV